MGKINKINKSTLNSFIDGISKLLLKDERIINSESAKVFLGRAKERLVAVNCLAGNDFSADDIDDNLTTCYSSLPGEVNMGDMSGDDKVSACCEAFNIAVVKFTEPFFVAKRKKETYRRNFLAVGIIGEVLELIVSVISTFIDANWFGWAVVGVRTTQIICLVLSLFSVIAFCFDVVPSVDFNGKTTFRKRIAVAKTDHNKLIFGSFMFITLLIGAILTIFILKGLPLFASLILLGFAAIVFISFLVTIKITNGKKNFISENGFKLIDKIINIVISVLFFFVMILGGAYLVKPQYLYGTSTITYKIDDITQTKSVVYNQKYSIEVPQKTGYTFLGLYDKEENGVQYVDAKGDCVKAWDSKIRNENKELFAQWKINTYTFIYNIKGGEGQDLNNFECDYEANLPTLDSNVFKRGYTFLGWTTSDAKLLSDCNGILVPGREKLIFPVYDIPTTEKNIYLYAKWQGNINEIIFDGNGAISGSMSNQQIATDKSANLNANKYSKKGYDFAGWSETKNGDIKYINSANYIMGKDSAYFLYAVWTAKTYEITFEFTGGTGENDKPIATFGTLMPTLSIAAPRKTGYSFTGFYDKENGGEIYYNADLSSEKTFTKTTNVILYAVWTANKYPVTFYTNSGTDEFDKVTATYNSEMPTLSSSAPTRTGFTFTGFFDKAINGVKYYNADLTSARIFDKTVDITLYAVWKANKYAVTFDTNGGTVAYPSQNVTFGENFTFEVAMKIGYTFQGWCIDLELTNKITDEKGDTLNLWQFAEPKTLYAKWLANVIAVNFNSNGGNPIPSTTATFDNKVIFSASTRKGYTFQGWCEDDSLSKVITDNSGAVSNLWKYTEAITLYAKWEVNQYDVIFVSNGGNTIPSTTATFDKVVTFVAPKCDGYTFQGWYSDLELRNKITDEKGVTLNLWQFAESKTLYAKWLANDNSIIFNKNSNSVLGIMQNQIIKTGETKPLNDNLFSRPGYKFIGWVTLATSIVCDYKNGADYTMGTKRENVLYALWQANINEIIFDGDGATGGSMSKQQIATDTTMTLKPNEYFKDGYTFRFWSKERNGEKAYLNQDNYTMGNESLYTLFVVWLPNENVVIFDGNGGKGTMENQIIKTGEKMNLSANLFTRADYTFMGWATSPTGSVIYANKEPYTMGVKKSNNLYAVWSQSYFTDGLTFEPFNEGYKVLKYTGQSSDVTIPYLFNNKKVISIGDSAFVNCSALKNITIPSSVTSINRHAFLACSELTSIFIPKSVTTIGEASFVNCSKLTSISISSENNIYSSPTNSNCIIQRSNNELIVGCNNSIIPNYVTKIAGDAFHGCHGLTSITIPNSVINIGRESFYGCINLESIKFSSALTEIGKFAFEKCTALTSIIIPRSVTNIGYGSFMSCPNLISLEVASENTTYYSEGNCIIQRSNMKLVIGCNKSIIPNNVKMIESYAFWNCSDLKNITIPSSVTSIGDLAFTNCIQLTSIIIPRSVMFIGMSAFRDWQSNQIIHFKGRSAALSGWDSYWNSGCYATICWNCPH